jgi:hypothetical protein
MLLERPNKTMDCVVTSVSSSTAHGVSKIVRPAIHLIAGLGVDGDAHIGVTVQHRSRVARNPSQLNLRQVHLIHAELHDELSTAGFTVSPGAMGENITTRGVDLLALPKGARLAIGPTAIIEVTGLRNPCTQLDGIEAGLMNATLARDKDGNLIRKAGVMAIVVVGGVVEPGHAIEIHLPPQPHNALEPV